MFDRGESAPSAPVEVSPETSVVEVGSDSGFPSIPQALYSGGQAEQSRNRLYFLWNKAETSVVEVGSDSGCGVVITAGRGYIDVAGASGDGSPVVLLSIHVGRRVSAPSP